MANTGYKINPYVQQIFTTGPNSGSLVTSSFITTFDTGSDFLSSSLCNNNFYYKIFDPINCPISGYCIAPTLYISQPTFCDGNYNYDYNISYNINNNIIDIPSGTIEFSLSKFFPTTQTGSVNITYLSSSETQTINISPLSPHLPYNYSTPVYFRLKNQCGYSSSVYSNIISSSCPYDLAYVNNTSGSYTLTCDKKYFTIHGNPNELITIQPYGLSFENNFICYVRDNNTNQIIYSFNNNDPQTDFEIELNLLGVKNIRVELCFIEPEPIGVGNCVNASFLVIENINSTTIYDFKLKSCN